MGEDSGDKTEEPTPNKIREARKKGQIAKSQEITSAIMLLVSFYTFKLVGPMMLERISTHTTMVFSLLDLEFSSAMVGMLLVDGLKTILLSLAPLIGMTFTMVIIIESMQTGFLFSLESLSPKFENLNPINGFKKFFALKQYIELLKSIIKMAAVGTILYYTILDFYPLVTSSQQQTPFAMIGLVGKIIIDTISRVGAVYFALAIFDYFYQKYEYMKSLKMSKKEIKEEYKRLEGDPIVKQRQREAQRAMSQGRQMGQVPGADVVVTNPTHIAVAIKYDPEKKDSIPMVVAKGQRLIAEEIKQIADNHNIPIIENPPVARLLFKNVDIGHYVPKESFKVVAEILAFVFHLKNKKAKANPKPAFDR
ncbi:MAG: flagellar biosynthesis protein FlhB [Candidatus Marinamargulisbacteria bacterium]